MSKQAMSSAIDSVSIKPGVSVLSVLRHLNYHAWFALAEFVDNALQSYLENKEKLQKLHGKTFRLQVRIDVDPTDLGRITIRDNAAGIDADAYTRAFKPAALPPNATGLSEFGMGMKSAACWFSPVWSVRTSALGELVERTVTFDIDSIVRDEIDELKIEEATVERDTHYTEIVLAQLHKPLQGRTLGKIREHLTDIYRVFTRLEDLELYLNNEKLTYEEPEVLFAPFYKDNKGKAIRWQKTIDFDFGSGYKAKGFVAIRKIGDTARAGIALFRRGRLIQGSGDSGYRPQEIFGASNSYMYQRVFGELHLDGFEVSHTKDGFRWNESEEVFLEFLKEELQGDGLPLLQQAREYRAKRQVNEFQKGAETAVEHTAATIEEAAPPVLSDLRSRTAVANSPTFLSPAKKTSSRNIEVEFRGSKWDIHIELTVDPAVGDWLEVSESIPSGKGNGKQRIGLRMSLVHPFMERFGGTDAAEIEPLLRVAAAIGLAEILARQSGVKLAGTVRRNINELLRSTLSKP